MKNNKHLLLLMAGVLSIFTSPSRAEIPGGSFPTFDPKPTIEVVHYDEKTMDPFATYTIPGSSFAYNDVKLALSTAIATFILPSGLSQIGRDAELAKTVGSIGPQLPDLDKMLAAQLEQKIGVSSASGIRFAAATEGQAKIQLSPRGTLTSDKEGLVGLAFYLDTRAFDKSGNRAWWNRYYFRPEIKKNLLGLNGWLGDDGALAAASDRILQMMLAELQVDLAQPPNVQTKDVRFKNCMGGEKNANVLLRETSEHYIVKKDLGRTFGPTTIILLKSACQLAESS